MPDVSRSDSQRSDVSSQRPRVSFNRDVHVKRIAAPAADGAPRLPSGVHKERPTRLSKRELTREARRVLEQAGAVRCTSSPPPTVPLRTATSAGDLRGVSTPERPRKQVSRSRSDAVDKHKQHKNGGFLSLDRLAIKRSKQHARSHSDTAEHSPTPRPRKNILKKSHSDSEAIDSATLVSNGTPRSGQLSPIIEAPSENTMHSSQMTARPTLTRGHAVDKMVRRLSQDATLGRGPPPRNLLVSPSSEGRSHNNNMPFSYTEPPPVQQPTSNHSPPTSNNKTAQVIYAEVVVGGDNSKQTVHTRVQQCRSDDEGVEMMERFGGRGRADGMDSRRRDVLESYGGRYDSDDVSSARRNLSDNFIKSERYVKSEFRSSGVSPTRRRSGIDEVDKPRYYERKDPLIQSRIDSNDLSLRRDRLESRIENQRKDRLFGSRVHNQDSFNNFDAKIIDNNRKYPSEPARFATSYTSRKDFLNSQIDHEDLDLINRAKEEHHNRSYIKSSHYIDSEYDSYGKKDLFADSGIEIDYRKDSTGTRTSYEDVKPTKETLTPKVSVNVTRVELNGNSDEEMGSFRYNKSSSNKKKELLTSTRLVQEQTRVVDAVPSSTVLIRHYAPGKSKEDEEAERKSVSKEHRRKDSSEVEDERADMTTSTTSTKKVVKKKQGSSAMERVRQLFTRSGSGDSKTLKKSKKEEEKKAKQELKTAKEELKSSREVLKTTKEQLKITKEETDMDEEDPLTRYTEYKGSQKELDRAGEQRQQRHLLPEDSIPEEHPRARQRLATPSSSPSPPRSSATLTRIKNRRNRDASGGGNWFKSLDRLTKRGKTRTNGKIDNITEVTTEDESRDVVGQNIINNNNTHNSNKNLRFFGDTDIESVTSGPQRRYRSNNRLQVPSSRGTRAHHRSVGDVGTSSADSTTEGEGSQRSVVYLHAATVGDIPVSRRARSREELSSTGSTRLQPHTRTVSRSISVLAPWRPRHYRDGMEVHYNNEETRRKPPKAPPSHVSGTSTINRSTVRRDKGIYKQKVSKAASVESLSHHSTPLRNHSRDKKRSNANLSTSVESLNRKGGRNSTSKPQLSGRDGSRTMNGKKSSAMNASAVELDSSRHYNKNTTLKKNNDIGSKKSSTKVSRSASMPKDSRVTSGWFKIRSKK